ncbi:hypothetical protein [Paenibacillus tyrfis]|uniref:hypothetical protein n=1 Tax=Paenibacillus tyrfis TaxID=1501230 RepID=UPI0015C63421|nr:hypothetical protein [Paenibacillus tyrfis]
MIDVNTIVGDPLETPDGLCFLPKKNHILCWYQKTCAKSHENLEKSDFLQELGEN